jgi:hypothetical protein
VDQKLGGLVVALLWDYWKGMEDVDLPEVIDEEDADTLPGPDAVRGIYPK